MFDLKEWIVKVTAWINAKETNTELGTSVGITNYTSKAGAYTIPSDGLIWLQCRYTASNYIGVTVCNSDGTNERSVQIGGNGGANINTMFPVFKGMKAWRSSNNGTNNFIDFIPYAKVGGVVHRLLNLLISKRRWATC